MKHIDFTVKPPKSNLFLAIFFIILMGGIIILLAFGVFDDTSFHSPLGRIVFISCLIGIVLALIGIVAYQYDRIEFQNGIFEVKRLFRKRKSVAIDQVRYLSIGLYSITSFVDYQFYDASKNLIFRFIDDETLKDHILLKHLLQTYPITFLDPVTFATSAKKRKPSIRIKTIPNEQRVILSPNMRMTQWYSLLFTLVAGVVFVMLNKEFDDLILRTLIAIFSVLMVSFLISNFTRKIELDIKQKEIIFRNRGKKRIAFREVSEIKYFFRISNSESPNEHLVVFVQKNGHEEVFVTYSKTQAFEFIKVLRDLCLQDQKPLEPKDFFPKWENGVELLESKR